MIHLGDITKISGYDAPVVDVITGGSPCQDLSVAGKRAGLAGERSGLFMEQMRIVKEMRERDRKLGRTAWAVRPRYMVWENVPGAFSSGNPKGSDFAAVIEEIIKVAEPDACVRVCVPDGGWAKSGCYYAEDGSWSIAWRVHDAQFWGVPQRRKRIALVADFGGLSAPEILFERKGLRWDSAESGTPRQGTPAGTEDGADETVFTVQGGGVTSQNSKGSGIGENISYTLNAVDSHAVCYGFSSYESNSMKSSNPNSGVYVAETSRTLDLNGGTPACNQGGMAVLQRCRSYQDVTGTLNPGAHPGSYNGQDAYNDMLVAAVFEQHSQDSRYNPLGEICETVSAKYGTGGNNQPLVAKSGSCVRRLTPLECERLQGFPGGWTDIGEWTDSKGKKHKEADSPRYKALGNSIALPFWQFLARRICAQYERQITMASLFDGIGGFPLAFQAAGAIPVWASEIEEFPIAVTKKHFPEVAP